MPPKRKFLRDQKGKFTGRKLKTSGAPSPTPGTRRITKHDGSVQIKKGATIAKKKKPEKPRAKSVKKILRRSGD